MNRFEELSLSPPPTKKETKSFKPFFSCLIKMRCCDIINGKRWLIQAKKNGSSRLLFLGSFDASQSTFSVELNSFLVFYRIVFRIFDGIKLVYFNFYLLILLLVSMRNKNMYVK